MKNAHRIQRGFSILEALVAMAIIAGAFLPLLMLQGQLTRTALAVERSEQLLRGKTNALSYLRTLNPSLRPEGEEPLGDGISMAWQSTPLTQPRPVRSMGGEVGRFNITLYEVSCTLSFPDGRTSTFSSSQVGWIATRPADEFF